MPATKVLDMVTVNGARNLLWKNQIGSLEIDKKADLVIGIIFFFYLADFGIYRNIYIYIFCKSIVSNIISVNQFTSNMAPLHFPVANIVTSMQVLQLGLLVISV